MLLTDVDDLTSNREYSRPSALELFAATESRSMCSSPHVRKRDFKTLAEEFGRAIVDA